MSGGIYWYMELTGERGRAKNKYFKKSCTWKNGLRDGVAHTNKVLTTSAHV